MPAQRKAAPKPKKRSLDFIKMDVFTSQPLAGNQLAVFTDARTLTSEEMQSLAREMNLSETTFILPRSSSIERKQGIKTRIFTVTEELPFAGHPTLGTAFAIRGKRNIDEIVLELNVGRVPVRFSQQNGAPFGEMTQRDPQFGAVHNREEVARAAGLALEDIDSQLPVQTVSTGLPQAIVPVRTLAALQSMKFQWSLASAYLERSDARFFYFVCRETVDRAATLHARMLFYNGEDPATGSAGGCTAAWMVANGVLPPEKQGLIEQGLEMKRPSQIFVRASMTGSRVHNVRVGGCAVEIMRGKVTL